MLTLPASNRWCICNSNFFSLCKKVCRLRIATPKIQQKWGGNSKIAHGRIVWWTCVFHRNDGPKYVRSCSICLMTKWPCYQKWPNTNRQIRIQVGSLEAANKQKKPKFVRQVLRPKFQASNLSKKSNCPDLSKLSKLSTSISKRQRLVHLGWTKTLHTVSSHATDTNLSDPAICSTPFELGFCSQKLFCFPLSQHFEVHFWVWIFC